MDSIFIECFGGLKDPRVERTKKHLLLDIIVLALCGVISGAQSWEEIEDFGNIHKNWFASILELPNGIPSHDTMPKILNQLFIKGAIVTLDAMGCQEDTVAQIYDGEADYVIALKGNQGALHELVKDSFDMLDKGATALQPTTAKDEVDGQHGRIDQREIQVIAADKLSTMIDSRWKGLNSIARVIYTSEAEGQTHIEKRFYISSLPTEKPLDILLAIRSHWQIESCLHWSLDVTFREDDCRIRDENAALNMSWLRKFALGLLKNEKSFKRASIRRKQLRAWTSPSYLTEILKQG